MARGSVEDSDTTEARQSGTKFIDEMTGSADTADQICGYVAVDDVPSMPISSGIHGHSACGPDAPGRVRHGERTSADSPGWNLNFAGMGATGARPLIPSWCTRRCYTASSTPARSPPSAAGRTGAAEMDWRTRRNLLGSELPSWLQKEEAHAPPAMTTVFVRIVPSSVTTPLTRPALSSMPRAAQCWCTVPPAVMIARPATGTAFEGSAVPSVGEKTPPFHLRPVALPLSLASSALSICVVTPTSSENHRHFAQPVSSCSSFDGSRSPQRRKPVSSPVSLRYSLPKIDTLGGDR